jgi:hypothetical protein
MNIRTMLPTPRSACAWLVLGAAAVWALLLLNGAVFAAWMAGGPPNPYPQGWAMLSQSRLAWACAVAIGGIALFRIIQDMPTPGRLTRWLAVVAIVFAMWPSASKFIQIDRCLDNGGRWNDEGFQCERSPAR